MAFRKAIGAKSFNLFETVLREFGIIAARDHVADHFLFVSSDGANITEGRHRAAQAIGFLGSKLRGLDRNPHRLLLKQRYAERLVQNTVQFVFVAM